MTCEHCEGALPGGALFCPTCGQQVLGTASAASDKATSASLGEAPASSAPPPSPRVRMLVRSGKVDLAIKMYRMETGATADVADAIQWARDNSGQLVSQQASAHGTTQPTAESSSAQARPSEPEDGKKTGQPGWWAIVLGLVGVPGAFMLSQFIYPAAAIVVALLAAVVLTNVQGARLPILGFAFGRNSPLTRGRAPMAVGAFLAVWAAGSGGVGLARQRSADAVAARHIAATATAVNEANVQATAAAYAQKTAVVVHRAATARAHARATAVARAQATAAPRQTATAVARKAAQVSRAHAEATAQAVAKANAHATAQAVAQANANAAAQATATPTALSNGGGDLSSWSSAIQLALSEASSAAQSVQDGGNAGSNLDLTTAANDFGQAESGFSDAADQVSNSNPPSQAEQANGDLEAALQCAASAATTLQTGAQDQSVSEISQGNVQFSQCQTELDNVLSEVKSLEGS